MGLSDLVRSWGGIREPKQTQRGVDVKGPIGGAVPQKMPPAAAPAAQPPAPGFNRHLAVVAVGILFLLGRELLDGGRRSGGEEAAAAVATPADAPVDAEGFEAPATPSASHAAAAAGVPPPAVDLGSVPKNVDAASLGHRLHISFCTS